MIKKVWAFFLIAIFLTSIIAATEEPTSGGGGGGGGSVPQECIDNDGGENVYVASDAWGPTQGTVDMCVFTDNSKGTLREAVCENGLATHRTVECPGDAPYCSRAVCSSTPPKCEDTDGGNNPYIRGTITEPRLAEGPTHTDYCENLNTYQPWNGCDGELCGLREYYCLTPYVATTYQDIECPQGCKDGACIKEESTCTDSDGGQDYYVKGVAKEGYSSSWDVCFMVVDGNSGPVPDCTGSQCFLSEQYCSNEGRSTTRYFCPNGCQDGACIEEKENIELHSAYIDGNMISIEYSKNFVTCAHIYVKTGKFDQKINFICTSGNNMIASADMNSFGSFLDMGTEIKICHGNNGNICSEFMVIKKQDSCTDSDGEDYFTKGYLTGSNIFKWDNEQLKNVKVDILYDYCDGNRLYEARCVEQCSGENDACNYFTYFDCENGCENGACIKESGCTDSDGGKDYYVKGECNDANGRMGDGCIVGAEHDGWLREIVCENNACHMMDYNCPNGCKYGVCIKEDIYCNTNDDCPSTSEKYCSGSSACVKSIQYVCENSRCVERAGGGGCTSCPNGCENGACIEEPKCTDSDGGRNYFVKGFMKAGLGDYGRWDSCHDEKQLVEYYCSYNEGKKTTYNCPNGCKDGACISEIINKGFRNAYWQCYDGYEQKQGDSTSCKSSETWKQYAEESCSGHCYEDNSKCGINSFSVYNECELGAGEPFCGNDICERGEDELVCSETDCKLSCPEDCSKPCYPKDYICPDGTYVPWCKCDAYGNKICKTSPENQCSQCGDDKCTAEEVNSCSEDCSIYENYLLLKDIGPYKFRYAEYKKNDDNNYGQIVAYAAVYSYYKQDIKATVIELANREAAEKAFRNEILRERYSISYLGDSIVYLINREDAVVWMHDNKIIGMDTISYSYPVLKPIPVAQTGGVEGTGGGTSITGNVVGRAIAQPVQTVTMTRHSRLQRIREHLEEEAEPVIEKPASITREKIPAKQKIPGQLALEYLGLYPNDMIIEAECGNNICENSEPETCPDDCEISVECPTAEAIEPWEKENCLENGGKWVTNEYVNNCPVPPYCVYEEDNEITEVGKLAIIMKLEKLGISINQLRNTAKGLANYYRKTGNDAKADVWENAAEEFTKLVRKIGLIQKTVRDSDLDRIRTVIREFISVMKERLRGIINSIIYGLTEEEYAEEVV